MFRLNSLGALSLLLIGLGGCEKTAAPKPQAAATSSDSAAVRQCFDDYRQAILDQDGASAVALVDARTRDYYDDMRTLALTAQTEQVRDLSTVDKLMVLMIRQLIPAEQLRAMTAESLFVHAVDQGWIGRDSVVNNSLGEVTVFEDHATGYHVSEGQQSELKWVFRKEDGRWRLDILSLMPAADQAFNAVIEESGQTSDEFVVSILQAVSGQKVDDAIWEPIGAGEESP